MTEAATDFDAAFKEFSAPEDKKTAEAAPAAVADTGAEGAAKPADEGGKDGSGGEAAPAATDGGSDAVVDASAPAAASDAAPVAAEVAAAESGKDGAAPAAAAEVKADEKPAVDADDVLNRLAKIVSDTKPAAEDKPAADAPAAEVKPIYSDEEQEFLTGYDKDWGDVVRGEGLKRRAEYRELMQYIFSEVVNLVAPIKETTSLLAERTHLTDIKTNVPDYSDALRDQVVAWTKKQPEYLQAAYDQVIQAGTADEVRDLVERYRKETGQAAPVAAAAATNGKDNELSGEAKQAAAALAPVESKRSGVQQPGDPANFDDAWKQFAVPDQKD